MVDDVRPFLVNTAGKWNWTGNVVAQTLSGTSIHQTPIND